MKSMLLAVFSAVLLQVQTSSVHLCSCLEPEKNHHQNVTNRGCDPGIHLRRLQIGPVTSPGSLKFKFKMQSNRSLTRPHIDFSLLKLVPLPCLGGFGSCSYSLCGYEQFALEDEICTGWGCKCPMQAGVYHSGLVSIDMPDLRILGPAAYGPMTVKVKLHEGKKVLHCARFKIHVVLPRNATETIQEDSELGPSLNLIDAAS